MPTDPNLYPHHKPKTTHKEISTSSSLAFTSTLSSLLSKPTSGSAPARPRPSKSKPDIFSAHNKNTKKRAAKDLEEDDLEGNGAAPPNGGRKAGWNQDIGSVDDRVLHRSKRKMEQKAKLYNEMKRGGGSAITNADGSDRLVDFDRKWAEREAAGKRPSDSEDSAAESDTGRDEIIDYEDEYGRSRRGTRADVERMQRKKNNRLLGAEELDRMSARPRMPGTLIHGDTVQTLAFNPDEGVAAQMGELAAKRDRSMTPPEMKHYEAAKEIRSKGVGFYSFSTEEEARKAEMEGLAREREGTERVRRERAGAREGRRAEVERRRREIGERRARKLADSFLDGLSGDLGGEGGEKGEDKGGAHLADGIAVDTAVVDPDPDPDPVQTEEEGKQ